MKRSFKGLALLAVLFLSASLKAQTADEIINKHLDAIGGKEKLTAIKSVKLDNTMNLMGNDAPNIAYIIDGKGYRNEMEMMGQKMVQVITDKGGWMINPMQGSTEPQELPADQLKSMAGRFYAVPLLNYADRGYTAELQGKAKVGDADVWKVKVTDKSGTAMTYFIDAKTFYVVQNEASAEMMGNTVTVTINYSDFKKTDYGWVVPYATDMNMGQFAISSKLNKIEVNPTIDPALFEMKK
jgi:hypothetical protein